MNKQILVKTNKQEVIIIGKTEEKQLLILLLHLPQIQTICMSGDKINFKK